jgi:pimeloyl-[acyl-carrier protein] synthase
MVTAEFNPIAPGTIANPHPMYRALREQKPVHFSEMIEAWILTRYDDVDAVLMDPRFSAERDNAKTRFAEMARARRGEQDFGPFTRVPTMLGSDPPVHTRLRRLVSKAFTPRAVQDLRPRIQEIVDELLDAAAAKGTFDLVADLAYPTPVIVIAEMLGVPTSDRTEFKRWSDDIVATLGGPFVSPDTVETARRSVNELVDYLHGHIEDRRKEPQDDLISGLIAAEEDGSVLSEDEIMATTILLLVAGNETTTHLIGNGTHALLNNRDQWDLLKNDPSLITSAVEELIRHDGPVQATARVATEPIYVAGITVDAWQVAMVLLGSANRDPAKYPDPDKLDITRNPTDHLGFGDGIHFCLGAPLARAEAQIAIGTLIKRFPGLKQESDPTWGGTFIIRGVKSLQVSA